MLYSGMTPIGNLMSGVMADWVGPSTALLISGIVCIGGGLLFACRLNVVRDGIRPIYRNMGILPAAPSVVRESS
ncbi:MAG: hypothetical protein WA003_03355 [Desulfuromonadaceae bacterium]